MTLLEKLSTTTSEFSHLSHMANPHEVLSSVTKMVSHVRQNDKDPIEMEVRVGHFTYGGEFSAGFSNMNTDEILQVINRLVNSLNKNCTQLKHWTKIPEFQMLRAVYPHNIRRTCVTGTDQTPEQNTLCIKSRIGKIDITTDRSPDLRFSICRETPINLHRDHAAYDSVTRNKPESVRIMQRASFVEVIPFDPRQTYPEVDGKISPAEHECFRLQFDISKVSPRASTKIETCKGVKPSATNTTCAYHCEIELVTKLRPLQDKTESEQQDQFIAQSMINRAKALLGSYDITTGNLLPQPKLFLFSHEL